MSVLSNKEHERKKQLQKCIFEALEDLLLSFGNISLFGAGATMKEVAPAKYDLVLQTAEGEIYTIKIHKSKWEIKQP